MNNEDKVKLPFLKSTELFFCNIFGRPFIYVEFEYQHKTETLGVIFEYNNPMLNRIRQAGYDDEDPDDAVRHYIQRVMMNNTDILLEEDEFSEDDVDPDYDEDSAGTYIYDRGKN